MGRIRLGQHVYVSAECGAGGTLYAGAIGPPIGFYLPMDSEAEARLRSIGGRHIDAETFKRTIEELDTAAKNILNTKGKDYPTNDDRLSNFKAISEVLKLLLGKDTVEITPGLVWAIYNLKHDIPFIRWVVEGKSPESESILERAADLQNYNAIGYAIGTEKEVLTPIPRPTRTFPNDGTCNCPTCVSAQRKFRNG